MKPTVKEIAVFGMLGALMYASKIAMDFLPNIHLLAVFTIAMTRVYRKKALYPIYLFVMLLGLFNGFNLWWVPHTYLWTILWGVTMLLPRALPKKWAPLIFMVISALHGFLYGTLYAPFQALMMGLDFKGALAWIAAGIPFDITHGISNFAVGALTVPIIYVLQKAQKT